MRKTDITGVCLNPCIDRALTLDGFEYGGTNRVLSSVDYAGGKGFNVAAAAAKLGLRAAASGFVFESGGEIILKSLDKAGVTDETLKFQGEVRVNLKVYDTKTQVVTELNSRGRLMDEDAGERIVKKIDELSKHSAYIVFGGSVAPGFGDDIYLRLIVTANKNGCKSVLDAEGELLKRGMEAKPFMIKPNLHELEVLMAKSIQGIEEVKKAAQDILKTGVSIVLVSLGKDGAVIATKDTALYAKGLKVEVKNTVGAGDTMAAGAVKGLVDSRDPGEVLKQAAAAATCSIMQEGTGLTDTSELKSIYNKIEITEI